MCFSKVWPYCRTLEFRKPFKVNVQLLRPFEPEHYMARTKIYCILGRRTQTVLLSQLGGQKKKNTICPFCLVPLWCFPCSQSFEAAGATGLPVGVEWGWDGVGYHAFQDVALRGHDVLDKEVGSLRDVQIVLKAGEDLQSTVRSRHFKYLLNNANFTEFPLLLWQFRENGFSLGEL